VSDHSDHHYATAAATETGPAGFHFGSKTNPIASFSSSGEIVNVRVGQTLGGKFILLNIGIESVEIGFVGFPPDEKRRIALGP